MSIRRPLACALGLLLLAIAGCGEPEAVDPLERAQAHFRRGEWAEAIEAATEAIHDNRQNAQAYICRGRAYHVQDKLDEALADFSKAVELNPKDPEAFFQRANVYRDSGEPDLRDADEKVARSLDPSFKHAYLYTPTPGLIAEPIDELTIAKSAEDPELGLDSLGRRKPADDSKSAQQSSARFSEDLLGVPRKKPAASRMAEAAAGAVADEGYSVPVEPRSSTEELLGIDVSPSRGLTPAPGLRRQGEPRGGRTGWTGSVPSGTFEPPPREALPPPPYSGGANYSGARAAPSGSPYASGGASAGPQPRSSAGGPMGAPARPLNPYSANRMRSTGYREPAYDPYGGLPGGNLGGGLQRSTSPYGANPYSSSGGAGAYLPPSPGVPAPYIPPAPGLRDEFGR